MTKLEVAMANLKKSVATACKDKGKEQEVMVCFSTGQQLGAVGTAFMCAAADNAPGFIDAATGKEMEDLLDKEEVKKGIISGKYKPCTSADIYRLFPKEEKK